MHPGPPGPNTTIRYLLLNFWPSKSLFNFWTAMVEKLFYSYNTYRRDDAEDLKTMLALWEGILAIMLVLDS